MVIASEGLELRKTICMFCHSHCPVQITVRNGRLEKVEGDQAHPHAKIVSTVVRACPRARAAAEWLYHPDRLHYPLKRKGERGEGKWETISWDEALDEIAEKLKVIKEKHGAEAVATSAGTHRTVDEYRLRFMNLFGSPNVASQAQICFVPTGAVATLLIGCGANLTNLRPGITKSILLVGANPEQHGRRLWLGILETKRQGAKLIVIDPRRTEAAKRADIWLQVRPGTDTALLMGMINVIIAEELYDREFVEKWCHGFDKLAERAHEYPPEKVAEATWVPADKIREAARVYAANKPATSMNMMGLEHVTNSIQAIHARYILPAITGNIDLRGGDVLRSPLTTGYISSAEIGLGEKLPPEQKAKALGADRFKLFTHLPGELMEENMKKVWGKAHPSTSLSHAPLVYRAMITGKPYPIRAMITAASNPMVTQANTKLVYKALKSLDLYVVTDFWLTPSAELADYVLPAASWMERPFIFTYVETVDSIEAGEAAVPSKVEGEYDHRDDYEFWRGLGIRLEQQEYWPWQTLEEAYDYRLAPLAYTLKEFMSKKDGRYASPIEYKKYERTGFGTPTGKVELYSTVLEKLGYDPLPRYEEPPESPYSTPELAKEYPLILITGGRILPYYHSEHRQIESMRKRYPEPIMEIHPSTASQLGIGDGDWAWIETPRGRCRQKCRYFEGIDPGVVHAQHGWWFPEEPGEEPWLHGVWESNINVVTDDEPDHCNKISGGWPLRAALCKVSKVKRY